MKLFGQTLEMPPLSPLVRSLLFLAAAFGIAWVVNMMVIHGNLSASAAVVRAHLLQDTDRVAIRLKDATEQIAAQESQPRLTSTPVFIDRIGRIAMEHDVPIQSIRPHQDQEDLFLVDIKANYHDFEGFIAALEELDVELVAFGARIENAPSEDPEALFQIQLLPSNNARTLKIPRLAELANEIGSAGRRNPFQRLDANTANGENRIDLSDILTLSGIAELGEVRIATIDNQDFQIGDQISGREITSILDDRILLRRDDPGGVELYILRFRNQQAGDNGAGAQR
ncbi:hypothetical protein [Minwuia sp.]|uniref:hypothetical protein n=1 Tax=Minwuia sp. TaxID=2493630 RepID=UPI003A8DECB0